MWIIDELSMMSAELFDRLEEMMREIRMDDLSQAERRERANAAQVYAPGAPGSGGSGLPFGGVQLILCGDGELNF